MRGGGMYHMYHVVVSALSLACPSGPLLLLLLRGFAHRGVALQVEFERQTLNPVFSLDRL
jgi:hypothetical protein